jgi:pimeloyl-ACP methyl ester carboxylesterase
VFAADVAGLMQRLGVTTADPAHVVGISLGGGVAFQLALDYPSLVKTLTIINSAPAIAASHDEGEAEIKRRVAIVQQLGMQVMAEALAPNLFPRNEHAHLREDFIRRWAENDPEAYIQATQSMSGWDVRDRIGEIRCPVLVIAADQDYSPVAVKEAYVKTIPQAKLVVIPDSHHAVPIERPGEFNAVLSSFLAEYNGSPPSSPRKLSS